MTIQELINGIGEPDFHAVRRAKNRWDYIGKPLGSLGELENIICKIAGLTCDENVTLNRRTLVVMCADNGVTKRGVAQTDYTVTTAVTEALGRGDSTVSFIAKKFDIDVLPVDIGMIDDAPDNVLDMCVRRGTGDITVEDAMTRDECESAIVRSAELVGRLKENGCKIVLAGEMGVGNTTTTAALASVLLNESVEAVTGRGSGLDDERFKIKIDCVRKAVERVNSDDIIDLISQIGGLDIAGLVGLFLGGAYYKMPIVADGIITCIAALCAVKICPPSINAIIPSHCSADILGEKLMKELGLSPIIRAGLHLGEGSGACFAMPLIDGALGVHNSGHTFDKLHIETYKHYV